MWLILLLDTTAEKRVILKYFRDTGRALLSWETLSPAGYLPRGHELGQAACMSCGKMAHEMKMG
jgi:hypothetical protein